MALRPLEIRSDLSVATSHWADQAAYLSPEKLSIPRSHLHCYARRKPHCDQAVLLPSSRLDLLSGRNSFSLWLAAEHFWAVPPVTIDLGQWLGVKASVGPIPCPSRANYVAQDSRLVLCRRRGGVLSVRMRDHGLLSYSIIAFPALKTTFKGNLRIIESTRLCVLELGEPGMRFPFTCDCLKY